MGMALAARQQGIDRKVVAVIGDGAITGGMAFEALAHAGHERPNMLLILNDNQMSTLLFLLGSLRHHSDKPRAARGAGTL